MIGALLDFKHHGVRGEGHQGVKEPFPQLHASHRALGIEAKAIDRVASGVEQQQAHGALQHHKTFKPLAWAGAQMAVGTHVGARLHHVEEALHQLRFLMEIVVAAQPRRAAGLSGDRVKQRLIQALERGWGMEPLWGRG